MKILLYGAASAALFAVMIWNTYVEQEQFFLAVMNIVNSNTKMLVVYNTMVASVAVLGLGLRKLFFGRLRAIEQEYVYERGWFAVTETCLCLSLLHDEIGSALIGHMVLLLLLKVFHWLALARTDSIEQTPQINSSTHVRLLVLLTILDVVDGAMVASTLRHVIEHGPSMYMMLACEYLILGTLVVTSFVQYLLHVFERRRAAPWTEKPLYAALIDLGLELLRSAIYIGYFALMLHYYGLPLHMLRPMWTSSRTVALRSMELWRFRRATVNMNTRYPDATAVELAAADHTCVICREELTSGKKLGCGHVFHLHCLRAWLQRQQTCPTCRRDVLDTPPPPPPATAVLPTMASAAAAGNAPIRPASPFAPPIGMGGAGQPMASEAATFKAPELPKYNPGELSVEQLRELVDREERRLQARLGALHAMYAQMDRIVQMQLAMQAPLAQYSDT